MTYRYSSHAYYVSGKEHPLLDKNRVLENFRTEQEEKYRMFVEGAISHAERELQIQKEIGEDDKWLPW